ncbi:helix-turn-helix transcriptional regulator [Micromonospora sp. ALFpr18c]|uniref:helix-turn-helix domain-containing protein n=2 Tax=Micromonosporaceae TaxID=28056 RepID=UPI00124B7328|nr:helix-turn-helix domain-containing protein [Micromonospora sp. ALFpr18c]KAB1935537.1 helix-turn-helix transcriptional regulator [Micromonospora sp. ALFpr18c]
MAQSWRDVRSRMNLDEAKVEQHKERMHGEVRATRLREMREKRGLTQQQVADRMNVSQPRVVAIESGELPKTEVGTVARYIAALGGKAEFVAEFDGERVTLS